MSAPAIPKGPLVSTGRRSAFLEGLPLDRLARSALAEVSDDFIRRRFNLIDFSARASETNEWVSCLPTLRFACRALELDLDLPVNLHNLASKLPNEGLVARWFARLVLAAGQPLSAYSFHGRPLTENLWQPWELVSLHPVMAQPKVACMVITVAMQAALSKALGTGLLPNDGHASALSANVLWAAAAGDRHAHLCADTYAVIAADNGLLVDPARVLYVSFSQLIKNYVDEKSSSPDRKTKMPTILVVHDLPRLPVVTQLYKPNAMSRLAQYLIQQAGHVALILVAPKDGLNALRAACPPLRQAQSLGG